MNRAVVIAAIAALSTTLVACDRPADVASRNLSYAADNFEINRRFVFYNGITDTYMLSIEGLCSLGNDRTEVEISVTCKVGPATFKKHFLGLSDNVTFFVEQVDPAPANIYQYRVSFRPLSIIPAIEVQVP